MITGNTIIMHNLSMVAPLILPSSSRSALIICLFIITFSGLFRLPSSVTLSHWTLAWIIGCYRYFNLLPINVGCAVLLSFWTCSTMPLEYSISYCIILSMHLTRLAVLAVCVLSVLGPVHDRQRARYANLSYCAVVSVLPIRIFLPIHCTYLQIRCQMVAWWSPLAHSLSLRRYSTCSMVLCCLGHWLYRELGHDRCTSFSSPFNLLHGRVLWYHFKLISGVLQQSTLAHVYLLLLDDGSVWAHFPLKPKLAMAVVNFVRSFNSYCSSLAF